MLNNKLRIFAPKKREEKSFSSSRHRVTFKLMRICVGASASRKNRRNLPMVLSRLGQFRVYFYSGSFGFGSSKFSTESFCISRRGIFERAKRIKFLWCFCTANFAIAAPFPSSFSLSDLVSAALSLIQSLRPIIFLRLQCSVHFVSNLSTHKFPFVSF